MVTLYAFTFTEGGPLFFSLAEPPVDKDILDSCTSEEFYNVTYALNRVKEYMLYQDREQKKQK